MMIDISTLKSAVRPRMAAIALTAAALAGCQTSTNQRILEERFFLNPSIDAAEAGALVTACYDEAESGSAADGAAVAAGLLLGGIIGAAAVASSNQESEALETVACLKGKGFEGVLLPDEFAWAPKAMEAPEDRIETLNTIYGVLSDTERDAWLTANRDSSVEAFEAFLEEHPAGLLWKEANFRIVRRRAQAQAGSGAASIDIASQNELAAFASENESFVDEVWNGTATPQRVIPTLTGCRSTVPYSVEIRFDGDAFTGIMVHERRSSWAIRGTRNGLELVGKVTNEYSNFPYNMIGRVDGDRMTATVFNSVTASQCALDVEMTVQAPSS